MGLILPDPLVLPSPNRTSAVQVGNMLYVSGHGAALLEDDTVKRRGKVDVDISEDEAYATSRALALKMIATVKHHVGDLDRVAKVVKILGMINSHPDFERPNAVLNGASDLIYEAFGPEIGQHARSSVGVETLVDRQPVEIEGIFLIQD
jgi:enamine deaminase RidA (YjgF/YER057c/UK114 family)|tara:strand:+ start:1768 stop:2214 length:447 start_codon:yes stop_codon:yes gene_type:complete